MYFDISFRLYAIGNLSQCKTRGIFWYVASLYDEILSLTTPGLCLLIIAFLTICVLLTFTYLFNVCVLVNVIFQRVND